MAEIQKPDFTYKWASGGALIAPTEVKIQTGWTAEVPPYQWENWSQNRQDNAIAHLFQMGIAKWDNLTEYQYSASGVKSLAMGSDGRVYRAKQLNTGNDPVLDTNNVFWEVAFASAGDIPTPTPVATAAQARALSDNGVFISPAQLGNAFSGSNQLLNGFTGYQKFPGRILVQWGTVPKTSAVSVAVTWPIPFAAFGRCIASFGGTASPTNAVSTGEPTNTGATFVSNFGGVGVDVSYICIGTY